MTNTDTKKYRLLKDLPESIPNKQDGRIEVNKIEYLSENILGKKHIDIRLTGDVNADKFPAIKQAIEAVLNGDTNFLNGVRIHLGNPPQHQDKGNVLFTTDDGVQLFNKDDYYWRVYDDLSIGKFQVKDSTTYKLLKSVSTEELAKAYVLVKQKLNQ